MSIPKLIHQTASNLDSLPKEINDNIDHIKKLNSDWQHNLYSDADIKKYVKTYIGISDFQEVEKLNPKYGVVLADLFRYLIIYNEGGVYFDIKSTARKSLSEVIKPNFNFIISQWRNKLGEEFENQGLFPELAGIPGGEFQQWHVIAAPKHPFLKAVIDRTLYNIRTYSPNNFGVGKTGVLRVSGPICYTLAIKPLLDHYPADIVDIQNLGFQYSIYKDFGDRDKHMKDPNHYSRNKDSIVLKEMYFDTAPHKTASIGDLLARELQENTDLVLKLAVFAIVSTASLVILIPILLILVLGWRW